MRRAAEERRDGEQHDRAGEIVPPPKQHVQERRHRQHDDIRENIAGGDPGHFLSGRAEVARHLGQRHVDNGRVQHFHGGGEDQADQNQPAKLGIPRGNRRDVREGLNLRRNLTFRLEFRPAFGWAFGKRRDGIRAPDRPAPSLLPIILRDDIAHKWSPICFGL